MSFKLEVVIGGFFSGINTRFTTCGGVIDLLLFCSKAVCIFVCPRGHAKPRGLGAVTAVSKASLNDSRCTFQIIVKAQLM